MAEGGNDKEVLDLFTKHSHHKNITVIYLRQDMFPREKYAKTINRQAHYIMAFKNPRDQLGVKHLLLQAFPSHWKDVMDVFNKVTRHPFGYMVLDLHPASDNAMRVFEDEAMIAEMDRVLHQLQLGRNPLPDRPGRLRFVTELLHERQSQCFGVHERVIRLRPVQEGNLIPQERLANALVQGLRRAVEGVLDRHQVPNEDRFYVSLVSDHLRSALNAFFVTG